MIQTLNVDAKKAPENLKEASSNKVTINPTQRHEIKFHITNQVLASTSFLLTNISCSLN